LEIPDTDGDGDIRRKEANDFSLDDNITNDEKDMVRKSYGTHEHQSSMACQIMNTHKQFMLPKQLIDQLNKCESLQELENFISKNTEGEVSDIQSRALCEHIIYRCLGLVCPGVDRITQFRLIKSVIENIAPFDYGDEMQLKCRVGDEVAKLVGQERSNKKRIHLLSIMCGHMRKQDAEKMINHKISNSQFADAKRHRRHPGPGVPYQKSTTAHRRRVSEKSIEEFVEWLNAADLLQNLAFGEKIVKFSNGFHVAIESVKRTESIQNIIRYYYRQFIGKREGTDSDESVDSDEESISDSKELQELLDYYSDEDDEDGKCSLHSAVASTIANFTDI